MRFADAVAVLAVGSAVFVVTLLIQRARGITRLRRRLAPHAPSSALVPAKERSSASGSVLRLTELAFGSSGAWRRLAATLERAGSNLAPSQLAWIMAASGVAPALLVLLVGAPAPFALLFGAVGAALPLVVFKAKGARRRRAFDDQLSDLLMTMAASARVGHTFRQSLQAVVSEAQEPASTEFGRVLVETDLGRPLERALQETAQRLRSRNFDYVVNVITIQREVGGSLASLFDVVSDTVRQRQQFTKKVSALTATGRMSAYVLVALPFVAGAGMSLLNPTYMTPLFSTSIGRVLLCCAVGGMAVGALILKKMVSFRIG